eukprot:TRINITY_DN1072_c6_g1_i1.p1 TRINITY_DN1072_c6_g1~~TRINITY_DN1072_c6_g1_i1.p1  ORF type:complete len:215 (+),score=67.47 TRINITY_DN1072_c6_g1_i1:65-646(+)
MGGSNKSKKSRSGIPPGDDVVFIGGIPRGATQGDLRDVLKQLVGKVKVRFVIDHATRHHKGFGFARLGSKESALKLLELTKNGLLFGGKLLNLGLSTEGESTVDDSSNEDISEDELPELEDDDFIESPPQMVPQVQQVAVQPMQPVQQVVLVQQPQQTQQYYVIQQQPSFTAPQQYYNYQQPIQYLAPVQMFQ